MTSKKQIEANRKNAKKGGVKTEAGKEVSKMNAMKHGILSHHLFIPGNDWMSAEELIEFQSTFFESMQPEGMLETLLVDRLFATFLKIQRLYIAETGAVKKQLEGHFSQNMIDQIENNAVARNEAQIGFFKRMRTSHGCDQLADGWKAVSESIKAEGLPLSKGMTRALDEELGGRSGYFKAENVSLLSFIVENNGGEKPMTKEDETQMNNWALENSESLSKFFRGMSEIHEWNEKDILKADKQSKVLPPLADLEKLQRYDAHLQRLMLQTLHELQRVQSLRLGHPMPPTVALDVTLDA